MFLHHLTRGIDIDRGSNPSSWNNSVVRMKGRALDLFTHVLDLVPAAAQPYFELIQFETL